MFLKFLILLMFQDPTRKSLSDADNQNTVPSDGLPLPSLPVLHSQYQWCSRESAGQKHGESILFHPKV